MSTDEKFSEWAEKYLNDFEERMKKLENPTQEQPDPAKEAEDEFIKTMKEINATSQTDQASGGGNEEDEFIKIMRDINQ